MHHSSRRLLLTVMVAYLMLTDRNWEVYSNELITH